MHIGALGALHTCMELCVRVRAIEWQTISAHPLDPFSPIPLSPQVPKQSCLTMSLWQFPREEQNTYYKPKLQKMKQSGF